jgi:hypothetical protein
MRFRFIAVVALWTILSGPIFAPVCPSPSSARSNSHRSVRPTPVRVPGR